MSDFKKIDLFKKENLLNQREISVGFAAEASIATMKQKDEVSANQINEFGKDCPSFLVMTRDKIFQRNPRGSNVVRNAGCLEPKEMCEAPIEQNATKLKHLLHHLISLKIISAPAGDKAPE